MCGITMTFNSFTTIEGYQVTDNLIKKVKRGNLMLNMGTKENWIDPANEILTSSENITGYNMSTNQNQKRYPSPIATACVKRFFSKFNLLPSIVISLLSP